MKFNGELEGEGAKLFQDSDGKEIKVQSSAFEDFTKPRNENQLKNNDCHLSSSVECERDCVNLTENLRRFRTENDYDAFWRGTGEWFFLFIFSDEVIYNVQNGALVIMGNAIDFLRTGQVTGVKGDNQWIFPDFSSIIWERIGDGDRMKIACYESDGGVIETLSFTLTFGLTGEWFGQDYSAMATFPISININDGDDEIGEYIVEYCHDIGNNGFTYHPAAVVDVQHNER